MPRDAAGRQPNGSRPGRSGVLLEEFIARFCHFNADVLADQSVSCVHAVRHALPRVYNSIPASFDVKATNRGECAGRLSGRSKKKYDLSHYTMTSY